MAAVIYRRMAIGRQEYNVTFESPVSNTQVYRAEERRADVANAL